jgi:tRNA-specific 2-thiouridylase
LENYLPNKSGKIINIENNEVVGNHIGLMYYTIGQRRGLNIGGTKNRCYVVGKDLDKNILYVSDDEEEKYLYSDSCIVEMVNWIGKEKINTCTAKFRYRQQDNDVNLEFNEDGTILVRYNNVKSVTPGQACVFYNGEECLGGGIIKEVRKDDKKLWYL